MSALPSSPSFASVKITSHQPVITVQALSGKRQSRVIGGQYFKLHAKFPTMTRTQFAPIEAFIMAKRGSLTSFTVTPAVVSSSQVNISASPLVNGASQTGTSLVTDGWGSGGAGATVLKAGDYLKLDNTAKVYMVTADATRDGSGNSTISIEPALITSPGNNEAVIYNSVPFSVYCDMGGITELSTNTSNFFEYSLQLTEAL